MLTHDQKLLLASLVRDNKELLFGPSSAGITNLTKSAKWEEIYYQMLESGASGEIRNVAHVRKIIWDNMKRRTMKKLAEQKTGGADLDELDFIVMEALGLQPGFDGSDYNAFFDDASDDLAAAVCVTTTSVVKQEVKPEAPSKGPVRQLRRILPAPEPSFPRILSVSSTSASFRDHSFSETESHKEPSRKRPAQSPDLSAKDLKRQRFKLSLTEQQLRVELMKAQIEEAKQRTVLFKAQTEESRRRAEFFEKAGLALDSGASIEVHGTQHFNVKI